MNEKVSSEAAELDADHGDVDPSLGAGGGRFIVAHQTAVVHQPAEGAFHDPAARQDVEALAGVGAFDDLDRQLGTKAFDPLGKGFAGVAAIHPQDAQPGEPAEHLRQEELRSGAFGDAGRGDGHAEDQTECVCYELIRFPQLFTTERSAPQERSEARL